MALIQIDWVKPAANLHQMSVFVCRHGHQSMNEVEHWPRSKILRFYKRLEEFLAKEFPKPK